MNIVNALVPYIAPLVFTFSVAGAAAAYHHLLQFLPEKQRQTLEYAVNRAVTAVEQTLPPGTEHDVKKDAALIRVHDMLAAFHVSLPHSVIDTAIESAVNTMNVMAAEYTPPHAEPVEPIAQPATPVKTIDYTVTPPKV